MKDEDDDDFPYRRRYLAPFPEMFRRLQTSVPIEWKPSEEHPTMKVGLVPFGNYTAMDFASDYYTEPIRVRCSFGKQLSPWFVWRRNRDAIKAKYPTLVLQRDALYDDPKWKCRECNTFNASVARSIILDLCGKHAKILDPSAGWGDRALAAAAADADVYVGIDPNTALKQPYQQLVRDLQTQCGVTSTRFKFLIQPFEDVEVPMKSFDLVLTSPPFYDLEHYSDEATQSVERYPTYSKWCSEFFLPYVQRCFKCVHKGGWVVLYCTYSMYTLIGRPPDRIYRFQIGTEGTPKDIYAWQAI